MTENQKKSAQRYINGVMIGSMPIRRYFWGLELSIVSAVGQWRMCSFVIKTEAEVDN